jgi:nucleotide-binding universal stress UspA family protein
MLPIRAILCPTDFSAYSAHAFQMACALARDYHARILLLHVAATPIGTIPTAVLPPTPAEEMDQLRQRLNRYVAPSGVAALERLVVEGGPAEEIVEITREWPCDLIVMGTHGRTGIRRMLMGSVAEAVLRGAPCPVLTVKAPPATMPVAPAEEPAAATV